MGVRVRRERDLELARLGRGDVIDREAGWVDGERATVPEVHEIRGVAEAFVDEGEDFDHSDILIGWLLVVK